MYALEAAARPFFFPTTLNTDKGKKKSRVSNSVVSQCAELLANATDSTADAGHHPVPIRHLG